MVAGSAAERVATDTAPVEVVEGVEAIHPVRRLLRQPGVVVGIDFETNVVRALHDRVPYVLSVAGAEGGVVARLTAPEILLPAMFEPFLAAEPWERASLVAHNATFEVGVLRSHGVAVDVDCTMIASLCLSRYAVPDGVEQPVKHGLADLVRERLGRERDKTIRDRDWSDPSALDEEGALYALQDAQDAAELWGLLRAELRDRGLWRGYELVRDSILSTVEMNLAGMKLDRLAHRRLTRKLESRAAKLLAELDEISGGGVRNHGSSRQVTNWIIERVLELPIGGLTKPKPPRVEPSLATAVRRAGGIRFVPGIGMRTRGLVTKGSKGLIKTDRARKAKSLGEAVVAARCHAQGHGYLPNMTSSVEFLDALALEHVHGIEVRRPRDLEALERYQQELDRHSATARAVPIDDRTKLRQRFDARLRARTDKSWRWSDRDLVIDKGAMARMPDVVRGDWPDIAEYLTTRARWTKARKLLDAFGDKLAGFADNRTNRVKGQFQPFKAVTGRQSCIDPNLQQQPSDSEFRALWVAPVGRRLVICDYGQIELRIIAIEAEDDRLLEVYREGRDVHAETMAVIGCPDRRTAKGVNFGIAYGGGSAGLAMSLGISVDDAARFLNRFLESYAGIAAYRKRQAEGTGPIEIRPGREVQWSDALHAPPTCRINYPIQGGAASVQMRAMRLIRDRLLAEGLDDVQLVASIHDEFILEAAETDAPAAAQVLQEEMVRALVEIYPEAVEMRAADLAEASIVGSWAEKG